MSNLLLETPFMEYIEKVTVKLNWGQCCAISVHTYLVSQENINQCWRYAFKLQFDIINNFCMIGFM